MGISRGGAGASSRMGDSPSKSPNRSSSLRNAFGVDEGEKPVHDGYAHVMLCDRDEDEDVLRDE